MSKAHRVIAGFASLLLSASLAACAGGGAIATVNGQAISQSDFTSKLEGSPVARGVLQQMVQNALIDQYAKSHNITVTDAEVAQKETALQANFPNGSWSEMLKARGLTEADVKDALTEQLILSKALAPQVTISQDQIQQYFAKNHKAFDQPAQVQARHILVADLATANKVEAALKAGGNFADLAKQYSTDPGSKEKGGELGWFKRGQMVPSFDAAAFSLPVGAVSQPVKSPFGYHIIQVEAKKPAVTATIANTQAKIKDLLEQQQEAPLIQPFLQQLQAKANIQIKDPRFADLFPSPPPGETTPAATTAAASAAPAASSAPSPAATK